MLSISPVGWLADQPASPWWQTVDWPSIGTWSGWAAASASVFAAVVALWIALQNTRLRIDVTATAKRGTTSTMIVATNVGGRTATIVDYGWSIGILHEIRIRYHESYAADTKMPCELKSGDQYFGYGQPTDLLDLADQRRVFFWPWFHALTIKAYAGTANGKLHYGWPPLKLRLMLLRQWQAKKRMQEN